MTVNMQLVVVFHHLPCRIIIIIIFYILSCIECIHVSWCTIRYEIKALLLLVVVVVLLLYIYIHGCM